jgi:hypothetical protein
MTTARQIIGDALTFHLNRLSPGETLPADTADLCLGALNSVIDDWNMDGVTFASFSDIDDDQDLHNGGRYLLSILTAERSAPTLVGGVPPDVALKAAGAKRRYRAINSNPAIVHTHTDVSGNILDGF